MNSIQCRILVFLVLLTSCFSPVCGKDKKPRQAIEKLSIDGPYLLKADDGSMACDICRWEGPVIG